MVKTITASVAAPSTAQVADRLQTENEELCTALARIRQRMALLSAEYAELLAHARAAAAEVAVDVEGGQHVATEAVDPLLHLRGFLEERGQLPPAGVPASQLLAEAFARSADADAQFGGAA